MKFTRRTSILLVLVVVLLASVSVVLAQTSANGVVPTYYETDRGGNVECSQVGDYELTSGRINYPFDASVFSPFTVTVTGDKFVAWSGQHNGLAVIVKGSNAAHVYTYLPPMFSDSGLASPIAGGSGNPADLSNLTLCWNPPVVEEEGQWCSPGYWRQPHHLASWAATGISPDELYSAYFGAVTRSNQGVRQNATTDPTLWQVLQSPQWYGGDAFNKVGELLSDAHPDVNFTGERVEDSCPLGR